MNGGISEQVELHERFQIHRIEMSIVLSKAMPRSERRSPQRCPAKHLIDEVLAYQVSLAVPFARAVGDGGTAEITIGSIPQISAANTGLAVRIGRIVEFRAIATFGGDDLYPTVTEKASALGFSLIQNHPFVDGNKRIGHAALETFLVINGCEIDASVDEQEQIILLVASGLMKRDEFTTWLRNHVTPIS